MNELNSLEQAALKAILAELGDERTAMEEQVLNASVLSRRNTGGGFFTELKLGGEIPGSLQGKHLGTDVWISVEGLSHGLGMILNLRRARVPYLEGYAVAPEDTSHLDFDQVPFAVAAEPGPLPANCS